MESEHVAQVLDAVIDDLMGRRGFRQVWESLDRDVKQDVRAELGVKLRDLDLKPKQEGPSVSNIRDRAAAVLLKVAEANGNTAERIDAARILLKMVGR